MSAEIIKFPEQFPEPEIDRCNQVVAMMVQRYDGSGLFECARMGLNLAENSRAEPGPAAAQHVVNGLMLAYVALGMMLGITEDEGDTPAA